MWKFLLSDQCRWIKVAAAGLVIAVSLWWGVRRAEDYDVTFTEALANLPAHAGQEVTFGGRLTEKSAGVITLLDRGEEIFLDAASLSDLAALPLGGVVTGRGIISDAGNIRVSTVHHHRFYDWKVKISLIVTVVMFIGFWSKFRWDFRRWQFEEREKKF